MATLKQKEYAEWILAQVGSVNPYNKQAANKTHEYYIYTSGYLAAYLGSLLAEDVMMRAQFERHIKAAKGPAARSGQIAKKT